MMTINQAEAKLRTQLVQINICACQSAQYCKIITVDFWMLLFSNSMVYLTTGHMRCGFLDLSLVLIGIVEEL
jgi:hypothetical protein